MEATSSGHLPGSRFVEHGDAMDIDPDELGVMDEPGTADKVEVDFFNAFPDDFDDDDLD